MDRMRRIVSFTRVTTDGYFAAPDGNLDWVVQDQDVDKAAMSESEPGVDTFLFGRKTYEMFQAFWPKVAPDPHGKAPHAKALHAKAPHGGGELSDEHRQMASGLNEMPKIVFSRTLKEATWKNTRLVPTLDPDAIDAMKRQPGKDLLILGSGSLITQLTEHGLIDEYQIIVSPILIGSGRSFADGLTKHVTLELRESRTFPTGSLLLRYARVR